MHRQSQALRWHCLKAERVKDGAPTNTPLHLATHQTQAGHSFYHMQVSNSDIRKKTLETSSSQLKKRKLKELAQPGRSSAPWFLGRQWLSLHIKCQLLLDNTHHWQITSTLGRNFCVQTTQDPSCSPSEAEESLPCDGETVSHVWRCAGSGKGSARQRDHSVLWAVGSVVNSSLIFILPSLQTLWCAILLHPRMENRAWAEISSRQYPETTRGWEL